MPSDGVRNPQPQYETDPVTGVVDIRRVHPRSTTPTPATTSPARETGPVLLEAMHLFLNQNNRIDWGKINYPAGENGGISGIVVYSTTRAEEDPRDAHGRSPGNPAFRASRWPSTRTPNCEPDHRRPGRRRRRDPGRRGQLSARLGRRTAPRAPRTWTTTATAPSIPATRSRSSGPTVGMTACRRRLPFSPIRPVVLGKPIIGSDNYSTWNQIRPGVFDGGYAFASYFPGGMANNTTRSGRAARRHVHRPGLPAAGLPDPDRGEHERGLRRRLPAQQAVRSCRSASARPTTARRCISSPI